MMWRRTRQTGPSMYAIRLIVETDDEAEVERLTEAICAVACPVDTDHLSADHVCRIPWFVITSTMSAKDAEGWRDLLNR